MTLAQKYQEIGAYIRERGNVKVRELCERFYLSEATVRRVLTVLAANGTIRRYHGGAMLIDPESLAPFRQRQVAHEREKQAIGK